MTDLTIIKGENSDTGVLHDLVLEKGEILIDKDAYDATLDRIYDVRGLKNFHYEIKNTHGSNGLTFKIEKARKEFAKLSDLVDGDFNKDILEDTPVIAGADNINDVVDISPESTAIRVRIKRTTGENDATLTGCFSVN